MCRRAAFTTAIFMEIRPSASLSFHKSRISDYSVIILATKAEFCKVWNLDAEIMYIYCLFFRETVKSTGAGLDGIADSFFS